MKRLVVLGIAMLLLASGPFGAALGQKKPSVAVPKLSEIPAVIAQLKDKDAKVRIHAAAQLGERGRLRARDIKPAIAPLLEMLKSDEDAGARRAAAYALAKADCDPKQVLEPLVEVLKSDTNLVVRAAAATALGSLGRGGLPAVPALREVQTQTKGATKAERDKRGLNRAVAAALLHIPGSGNVK